MESQVAIVGHPLHAMLVVFPLGLFMVAFLFDLIYLWRRDPFWLRSAFWLIVIGEVGGLAAVVPGLIDYRLMAMPLVVRTVATYHLILGLSVISLYGLQIWLRRRHGGRSPEVKGSLAPLMLLSFVSASAVGIQGALGGQLSHVYRLGVMPAPKPLQTPLATLPTDLARQQVLKHGEEIYNRACSGCHGSGGQRGNAPRLIGHSLPYLDIQTQVIHGRPPVMPAFGKQLSGDEIEAVTRYVHSLGSAP